MLPLLAVSIIPTAWRLAAVWLCESYSRISCHTVTWIICPIDDFFLSLSKPRQCLLLLPSERHLFLQMSADDVTMAEDDTVAPQPIQGYLLALLCMDACIALLP